MKKLFPIIAILGLALTILPSVIHLFGDLSVKTTFQLMAVGMVLWYAGATPWLGQAEPTPADKEVQI